MLDEGSTFFLELSNELINKSKLQMATATVHDSLQLFDQDAYIRSLDKKNYLLNNAISVSKMYEQQMLSPAASHLILQPNFSYMLSNIIETQVLNKNQLKADIWQIKQSLSKFLKDMYYSFGPRESEVQSLQKSIMHQEAELYPFGLGVEFEHKPFKHMVALVHRKYKKYHRYSVCERNEENSFSRNSEKNVGSQDAKVFLNKLYSRGLKGPFKNIVVDQNNLHCARFLNGSFVHPHHLSRLDFSKDRLKTWMDNFSHDFGDSISTLLLFLPMAQIWHEVRLARNLLPFFQQFNPVKIWNSFINLKNPYFRNQAKAIVYSSGYFNVRLIVDELNMFIVLGLASHSLAQPTTSRYIQYHKVNRQSKQYRLNGQYDLDLKVFDLTHEHYASKGEYVLDSSTDFAIFAQKIETLLNNLTKQKPLQHRITFNLNGNFQSDESFINYYTHPNSVLYDLLPNDDDPWY